MTRRRCRKFRKILPLTHQKVANRSIGLFMSKKLGLDAWQKDHPLSLFRGFESHRRLLAERLTRKTPNLLTHQVFHRPRKGDLPFHLIGVWERMVVLCAFIPQLPLKLFFKFFLFYYNLNWFRQNQLEREKQAEQKKGREQP